MSEDERWFRSRVLSQALKISFATRRYTLGQGMVALMRNSRKCPNSLIANGEELDTEHRRVLAGSLFRYFSREIIRIGDLVGSAGLSVQAIHVRSFDSLVRLQDGKGYVSMIHFSQRQTSILS